MSIETAYKMGKLNPQWEGGSAKSITFSVTEDCNLVCKYCYITGKNTKNKMSFDVAKRAVDYILSDREAFPEKSVIWEFIGGEPTLEMELIDKICDYIKLQMYTLNHPWFNSYMFNFSSNGILYHTPAVQNYIKKNNGHVSMGLSVDGNKIKHDLQRIYPGGRGSYDDVMRNVPLWQQQFPGFGTKATFAHDDIPYLKDSIISLWENGIKIVAANVVFEDVWDDNDADIFERQLMELADYILENELWSDYSVRFFSEQTGLPLNQEELTRNFCGSGKMLAIDYQGRFYPCVRFLDYSLNNREGYCIGDINNGINADKIRPFLGLTLVNQSPEECVSCEVASGCSWCTACNYDMADTDTIYQRATYICKMHKANARANEYYWNKFHEKTGIMTERQKAQEQRANLSKVKESKFLQFITSDDITPHCLYRNSRGAVSVMSRQIFESGIAFCAENGFIPVILGEYPAAKAIEDDAFYITSNPAFYSDKPTIAVYDNTTAAADTCNPDTCILLINSGNIEKICDYAEKLYSTYNRINITVEDIGSWSADNIDEYKKQMDKLVSLIACYYKQNKQVELNTVTDLLELEEMCNCDAGNNTFALAPNGKIYICPAFYFDNEDNHIGLLDEGINIKNRHLLDYQYAPICNECDAYHCKRCKFINKKLTSEYNTPPKIQCLISHIERTASLKLQNELSGENIHFRNKLAAIDYMDPLEKLLKKQGGQSA